MRHEFRYGHLRGGDVMEHRKARYVNIALGIWLVVSAYLWRHSSAQLANVWISGLIVARCAAVAIAAPRIRFFNTAVGVWLILSSLVLPRVSTATAWNNVLVGALIIAVSLVGPGWSMKAKARIQSPG